MRFFAKDLLATSGTPMEVSDWSDLTQFTIKDNDGSIKGINTVCFSGNKYYLMSGWDLYSFSLDGNCTYINTTGGTNGILDFAAVSYGKNIDELMRLTYEGAAYQYSYSIYVTSNDDWGASVKLSTAKNWAKCDWGGVLGNIDRYSPFIIYGAKDGKGAYTPYHINSSGSLVFDNPNTIDTGTINKMVVYTKSTKPKYIAVCDDGKIAIASSSYKRAGSTVFYYWDIGDFEIHQVGDGSINWQYVTYGNGLIVVASRDGDITYSEDDGETWTKPINNSGLNNIRDVVIAYNKIFILGAQDGVMKIVSTYNFKNYTESLNINFPKSMDYMFKLSYVDGQIIGFTRNGYYTKKTWKEKGV